MLLRIDETLAALTAGDTDKQQLLQQQVMLL